MAKGKKRKYILGIACVLGVGAIGVGVSQWDNIKAVYNGVSFTEEEIQEKRKETQEEVNKVLENYELAGIRTLTEEETQQLISGELSVEALTEKITQNAEGSEDKSTTSNTSQGDEKQEQNSNVEGEATGESSTSTSTPPDAGQGQATENKQPTESKQPTENQQTDKDNQAESSATNLAKKEQEIVSKYTAQMYVLQAKYVGMLESLKDRGIGVLNSIPSDERTFERLQKEGMPLLQEGYALERECDQEVEKVLSALESELKAIDKDTGIIKTMRSAYETEKSLKKAYYINLGMSML